MLILPVICFVAALASPAEAAALAPASEMTASMVDPIQEKEGDQALARYLQASRTGITRGATMVARFVGNVPRLGRTATLEAKRVITRQGGVEYTEVLQRAGDKTIQKELIARFMGGEIESSTKDNSKISLTPENYKFKYKGKRQRDSFAYYVLEVNPRKKREGLFKGEIWVDAATGLTLLETGRFVKSPSVFLKKVEFAREYTIRDGRAVPKTFRTTIQTRFWGPAELHIEYSDVTFEDPSFQALNDN